MRTDEQINGLEGRTMDAAVAEQVFGYEVRIATESDPLILICAADNCADRDSVEPGEPYLWIVKSGHQPERGLPHYSTDIAAAFLVIEKMRARTGVVISDYGTGKSGWSVTFVDLNGPDVYGETLPLAICRAALRAAQAEGK